MLTFWPVWATPQVGPWPNVLPSFVQRKIDQVDGEYHLSQPYALMYGSSGDDQARLHQLGVGLVALVALGDVGAVLRRQGPRDDVHEAR